MELEYNFFDPENKIAPRKGKVLISEPFLQDNYFKRSIVILTEHTDEGSVGFVLNKPVDLKVNEVVKDIPYIDAFVSLGGPVSTNSLHYIHTMGDIIPSSMHVFDNIYWGGEFEIIKKLISSNNINGDQIRFFLGYSGWKAHQLEDELEDNAWIVTDISSQEIMSPMNKHFWKEKLKGMGEKFQMWANFPENPQMN